MQTFGTDIEFMLVKDSKYFSAINIVQGDKCNRISVSGHQFFYDNVLAECAVKPAKSKKQIINNIRESLKIFSEMVYPYELVVQASQFYPDSELAHPDSKEIGCDPDWCAYKIKQMPPPREEIKNSNFRTCGGHIHIGSEVAINDAPEQSLLIRMLDLFLTIPSLWLDDDCTSAARRILYGQAGRFRFQENYGIEYRSLSNFWVKNPRLVGWVYDVCDYTVQFVKSGAAFKLWHFDWDVFFEEEDIAIAWQCLAYDVEKFITAINTSNKTLAIEFLELSKSFLSPKLISEFDQLLKFKPSFYNAWQL